MSVVAVQDLEMSFGERLIQHHVSLEVEKGCIFAVMGGSGCGKSTLLKHMVGLLPPAAGQVMYDGVDYWASDDAQRQELRSHFGMLFQSAALWSSMTLLENVCLPLQQQTKLSPKEREAKAREVLEWVELDEFADYYPADLSGGMKKRAGLARAIVAEPPLLFLDEPSAGLDPISSRRLDDLILDIRHRTGAAVVFVSHELASLCAIADDGIFLDAESKEPIAHGKPRDLAAQMDAHPTVHAFLHREVPPPAAPLPGAPSQPAASTATPSSTEQNA